MPTIAGFDVGFFVVVVARREDDVQRRRRAFYVSAARSARLDRARVRRRRRVGLDLDEAPYRPVLLDRGKLVVYLRRDAEECQRGDDGERAAVRSPPDLLRLRKRQGHL